MERRESNMRISPEQLHILDKSRFPSLAIDDMMEEDEVSKRLEMKKSVKHAMKQHPYEIYHSEKSGWFTSVDDPTQKSGKRKIRKCSEEKLWLALADWYAKKEVKKTTLAEIYPIWLEYKRTPRNQDNIKRIEFEWGAYYLKEPLSQKILETPLPDITSLMLREWAEALLKKHYPVDKKKFSRLFSIINQCFEYAADEDIAIVSENVWQKARKKINRELIVGNPTPSDEEQVFTDEERRQIKAMVYEDLERYKKQSSTAGLQILFLFETGLRIGECCGLKWSDVKNGRLYIQRQATNEGIKEWTKTSSSRRSIPLTKAALHILQDVQAFNQEHGFTAEWIFQNGKPDYDYRLSYNAADRKLRKLCSRLNTVIKSPHKLRKTCLSILMDCPDINNRTVQRFAGHSDISTTQRYYNFDRKSQEKQAAAIDAALSL